MKSRYKIKKVTWIIVVLILTVIAVSLSYLHISEKYRNEIYNFYNQVLGSVSEQYPEIEDKLIKDLFISPQTINKDYLSKYGLDISNIDIPNSPIDILKDNSLLLTIIFSISTISIAFIFIYYQKKQVNDIKKLDEYCKKIIKGEGALELKSEDESLESVLKNNIYDMTMLLKETNNNLNNNNKGFEKLIADISHQLKTPLTSLSLLNDLLYTDLPEDKKKEFLDASSKELDKIRWLIKTLLNIAKLDSKTLVLKKDNNNAEEMSKEIQNNFKAMCEAYNANITVKADKYCNIYCDKKWTLEAISNIIKNAIEHNSKNINIQVEENRIFTQIQISDDGEGISKKDINHIFERFYKSENSKENSIGLGLAFCKSIINNQDGEIKVESKKNMGTRFIIKLYK